MKNQVSAAILMTIIFSGISANSAAYGQQIIMPQVQPQPQPQNPAIDLNSPNLLSANSSFLVNNNCFNGVIVYGTSLITNELVPVCVPSDMMMNTQLLSAWGQMFNIDFTIKSTSSSNNDNNDNDDNNNHRNNHHNNNTPDYSCLFNPSQLKCASDNGECPDGFYQNEDGNCFPAHPEGCPSGYHSVDDDETGKCIQVIQKDVQKEWNLDRMEKLVIIKRTRSKILTLIEMS